MQIGIIVPHLAASQLSYLITRQVNKGNNFVIFQKHPLPPIQRVYTSVFPICEITKFKGVLIGTDLDSARYMINLTSPARKLYYPWHIEWLKHGNDYLSTVRTIMSPEIEVIARSHSYADQIKLMNREPSAIIEEFNLDNFRRYCEDHPHNLKYCNKDLPITTTREKIKYNGHYA
jgi:hypothetical protein